MVSHPGSHPFRVRPEFVVYLVPDNQVRPSPTPVTRVGLVSGETFAVKGTVADVDRLLTTGVIE